MECPCIAVAVLLCFVLLQCTQAKEKHGIIIDAGSFGSRVRHYKWSPLTSGSKFLEIELVNHFWIVSGVDDYADNKEELEIYLKDLMNGTRRLMDDEGMMKETTLYFMATGGLRALGGKAIGVIDIIRKVLADTSINPFVYDESHVTILSGNEEAYYAWIGANYVASKLNAEGENTVGIMELGGSSFQLAFIPESFILANKVVLELLQKKFEIYANSFLTFGHDAVIYKIRDAVLSKENKSVTIKDPCALRGDTMHKFIKDGIEYNVEGIGDVEACLLLLNDIVYQAPEEQCHVPPCGFAAYHQPPLPKGMTFYGQGSFKFSPRGIGILGEDGNFTLADVLSEGRTYCEKSYSQLLNDAWRQEKHRKNWSSICTMSLYMYTFLTKVFDYDMNSNQILASTEINGQNAEWTLGAMIFTEARHAIPEDCPQSNPSSAQSSLLSYFLLMTTMISSIEWTVDWY